MTHTERTGTAARIDTDGEPAPDRLRVAVVVGSTRQERAGAAIADWFVDEARQRADLVVDVIDLVDFAFPSTHVAEPTPAIVEFTARIQAADAFVVVTPEYNHSFPASLKDAIDYPVTEWHAKPVGFVSYGGVARGLRAVEALRLVFAELHAVTVRDGVSLDVFGELDDSGRPRDPEAPNQAVKVLLDQLVWWGRTLRTGRATRPYGG